LDEVEEEARLWLQTDIRGGALAGRQKLEAALLFLALNLLHAGEHR
jgi:hypothetical protein